MAPEVIQCEPYNEKCDIYSFGILLNELITGDYPYIEKDYGPIKVRNNPPCLKEIKRYNKVVRRDFLVIHDAKFATH